jgi:acyl carrier protein
MPTPVRETIHRHLAPLVEDAAKIGLLGAEARLREDLGLSSLDAVSLLMTLEEEFDVEISDEEVVGLRQLGDLERLLEAKLAARATDPAVLP